MSKYTIAFYGKFGKHPWVVRKNNVDIKGVNTKTLARKFISKIKK